MLKTASPAGTVARAPLAGEPFAPPFTVDLLVVGAVAGGMATATVAGAWVRAPRRSAEISKESP